MPQRGRTRPRSLLQSKHARALSQLQSKHACVCNCTVLLNQIFLVQHLFNQSIFFLLLSRYLKEITDFILSRRKRSGGIKYNNNYLNQFLLISIRKYIILLLNWFMFSTFPCFCSISNEDTLGDTKKSS